MNYARKLGWTLGAALGLATAMPAMAEDLQQYSQSSQYSQDSSQYSSPAESASASDSAAVVTVLVSEPSLVFSDGRWYTFTQGDWLTLDEGEWQALTSAAAYDPYADAYAMDDAMYYYDAASSSDDAGVWVVWIPTEEGFAGDEASSGFSPYAYELSSMTVNGIPLYSYESGQWYVLAPMADDELIRPTINLN